jgi:hypothetical protein
MLFYSISALAVFADPTDARAGATVPTVIAA